MKKHLNFLLLLLIITSCSDDNSGIENQCEFVGNGYVKVKRNSTTEYIEYQIDSAYYSTVEQTFKITNKSRDYLNSLNPYMDGINFYEINFEINSTTLKEGTYTHLTPINSNDTDVFNISLTIRENENSPLNIFTQYDEIPPNGGTLTISKNNDNCYNIDFEFVTVFNDSIKGNYIGDFVDFIPN